LVSLEKPIVALGPAGHFRNHRQSFRSWGIPPYAD
jgi:hypothetical protein